MDSHIGIGVMAFRLKLEVRCEVVTSIYFGDAGEDVAVEECRKNLGGIIIAR